MLDQSQLDDLSHADRLQRELALTFARALHSHTCASCGMLRVCTVVGCEFRPDDRRVTAAGTERYQCCECRLATVFCRHCDGTGMEPFETACYPPEPCSVCKVPRVESASDEVGGGDDEA